MDSTTIVSYINKLDEKRTELEYGTQSAIALFEVFRGDSAVELPSYLINSRINGAIETISESSGIYNVVLPHRNAVEYCENMRHVIAFILSTYNMATTNQTYDILDRLVEDNSLYGNPDNLKFFQHYVDDTGNAIKSSLELFLHPFSIAAGPANFIAQLFVRPAMRNNPDAIRSLNQMNKLLNGNTLMMKQLVYRSIVKDSIKEYVQVARLVQQGLDISFQYNLNKRSFGLEKIKRFTPQNKTLYLINILRRMVGSSASDDNSYSIYQTVSSIYNSEFVPECNRNHWLNYASDMVSRYKNGENIDSLLEEIKYYDPRSASSNWESELACQAKIIALCILKYVISGTGTNARQHISLFNTISGTASCVNYNRTIMVYEKNDVIDINCRAILYLKNEMKKRNYKISSKLQPKKFAKKSYENLTNMKSLMAKGKKSVRKTFFGKLKKKFQEPHEVVSYTGESEEMNIKNMWALTDWVRDTSLYLSDPNVLGFVLNIRSGDYSSNLIEPIRI